MIKLLHTADIHLDSPLRSLALRNENLATKVESATRSTLERIVEISIEEEIQALLISGDLFDSTQRSAKTAAFLTEQLGLLKESGIKTFTIKGNHDAENPISGEFPLPENVHTFDGSGGKFQLPDTNIWIHGVSFRGKSCPESLLGKFQQPVPDSTNIAMLHTSLSGASGHDNYAPCSEAELKRMGFDYWALGHIHKRQIHSENPWIVMPGIPQGRGMGELGPKSATLICIEEDHISVNEIPTSTVEFHQLEIDISGIESDDEIQKFIQTEFELFVQKLESDDAILRVSLIGNNERRWNLIRDKDVWENLISNFAENTERLWLESLELKLENLQFSSPDSTSIDELGQMMETIIKEDGFQMDATNILNEILNQLPAEQRAELVPSEESSAEFINELSVNGAKFIYAKLKGG